ncbi:glycosyltransferase involved in cell wall biosynthesis [Erythromicrobium ramosum]|uniref:Glycosyltransferase n=1 Tax=Erythrobacter ramosus TaxID=35811 RepID=A0A6I4ULP3_9SPHN|nr:glycosyltransferase [Erythrobacter ramosus]MBB3777227.1 glycosyltransferase involved in cell wall biosynthesis [Erythrobacter ramosus]MXP39941.1 glycosyltransferase [Erythrobacter ramosus]
MSRHVLHVVPYLGEAAGGPPVVVQRLVEGARAAGWQADIVTSCDLLSGGEKQALLESGATVMPSQLSALVGQEAQRLKEAVHDADLLHCHTLWSPLVSRSAALARNSGIPYILAPHGMLDPYSFSQRRLKKRLYLESVERRTINAAARIMFTTYEEKLLAENTFGLISNAVVVPLGADRLPNNRQVLRDRFFDKHRDLRGRPLLLFMGRLHPKKRPEILPDVISAIQSDFPEATLIFAGTGEESFVEQIKQRAHRLSLGDKVRFLGHLSGEAKFSALAAADLFLLPSRQENFGIAVAEALQAGVPVILTKSVNIWREIENAEAGIAVTDDDLIQKLAGAITTLLTDDERRTTMSHNAQRLASEAFSWDTCCRRTLEIYEDVLAQV